MKVTVIRIVVGALGTVTEGLLKGLEDLEIRGRAEIIQTSVLLRSAKILRKVLETWKDFLSLKLKWKTIGWRRYEKLSMSKMLIIKCLLLLYLLGKDPTKDS